MIICASDHFEGSSLSIRWRRSSERSSSSAAALSLATSIFTPETFGMASDVAAAFPPPLVALNMRGGHERVRRQNKLEGWVARPARVDRLQRGAEQRAPSARRPHSAEARTAGHPDGRKAAVVRRSQPTMLAVPPLVNCLLPAGLRPAGRTGGPHTATCGCRLMPLAANVRHSQLQMRDAQPRRAAERPRT